MVEFETLEDPQTILRQRDEKVHPVLKPYTPVWLVGEQVILEEEAVLFNVVFYDPQNGWLNRRYRYDAFNDVLYHMGERRISEAEALAIQQREPYLNGNAH